MAPFHSWHPGASMAARQTMHGALPLLAPRGVDGGQANPPAALVLVLHELHGMPPFLSTLVLHELGEAHEGNVVPLVVEGHCHVNVPCMQLHVYLLVDSSFTAFVEILTNGRHVDYCFSN